MNLFNSLFNEDFITILLGISVLSAITSLILSFSEKKPSLKNIYKKRDIKEEEAAAVEEEKENSSLTVDNLNELQELMNTILQPKTQQKLAKSNTVRIKPSYSREISVHHRRKKRRVAANRVLLKSKPYKNPKKRSF